MQKSLISSKIYACDSTAPTAVHKWGVHTITTADPVFYSREENKQIMASSNVDTKNNARNIDCNFLQDYAAKFYKQIQSFLHDNFNSNFLLLGQNF